MGATNAFQRRRGALPSGTRIHEEPNGDWWLAKDDGSLSSFRMPKNGFYFDDTSFGIAQGEFDPRKFNPSQPSRTKTSASWRATSYLYENTDYALLGWGYGVCFLGLSLITDRLNNVTQGMPKEWMMMLMTEKETCHEIMGRSVEAYIECMKLIQQAVGDYCFAWGIASTTPAPSAASLFVRLSGPRCSNRITGRCAAGCMRTPG